MEIASEFDGQVIEGTEDNDILTAAHNNVTLIGGSGIDVLESTAGADNTTMDGGPGSDDLIGFGTNDTASYANDPSGVTVNLSTRLATDGYGDIVDGDTDTLFGIENVTGSDHDDTLIGDVNANVLQGGAGNDTLTGNGGNDVFRYSFDLTQDQGSSSTFTQWLQDHGNGTAVFDSDPSAEVEDLELRDGTTQNFFSTQYTAWLNELVTTFGLGSDTNGDGVIDVGLNQNDPDGTPFIEGVSAEDLAPMFQERECFMAKTGKTSHERFYSDSFSTGDGGATVMSGDGEDNILDFGTGDDLLRFDFFTADADWNAGMSVEEQLSFLQSFFNVTSDGTDTLLTLGTDTTWSVMLENKVFDVDDNVFDHVAFYVNDAVIA